MELANIVTELESRDYSAHSFELDQRKVKFRTAKITPTKAGQFVTIWKRNENGITEPFAISDVVELFIIATLKETNFRIFIFPKSVLYENKILSDHTKEGKRGIRVYPIWDLTSSKQAQRTQYWQTKYFLEISQDRQVNLEKAKALLGK